MARLLGPAVGALALVGVSGTAAAVEMGADDEVRYVHRDLVLPRMTLTPTVDMRLINLDLGAFGGGTVFSQNIGVSIVPLDNLEVHANPLSFYAGDITGYGVAGLGATYRFVAEDMFEMGVRLSIPIGQTGPIDFVGMQGGFPMRVHGGDVFRLDTGIFVAGIFAQSLGFLIGDAQFSLAQIDSAPYFDVDPMIPLEASVQIIDEIYVGMDMGFGIVDVDVAEDTVFVPLGFRFGGTVPVDGRPFVDLSTGFRFPFFLNSFNVDGEAVLADFWEVQLLRADMHFDLGA